MTRAFSIYVFLQKHGPSSKEGDLLLLCLVSVPVVEFAVTGLKGQRACLFDKERMMTGILVFLGNDPVPSLSSALV